MNPFFAFVLTFVEAILTLTLVRWTYRRFAALGRRVTGRRAPPTAVPQSGD